MPDDSQAFSGYAAAPETQGGLDDNLQVLPDNHNQTGLRALAWGIATILITVILVVFVQWKTGAWRDDFSATGDEASHFTSAVAMSSYFSSGQITHPYDFASQYYLHYPKIAFGKWPPAFYVLSGIWFVLFSPSRLTGMLFIAFETVLLSFVAFRVASRLLSPLLSFIAAITVVMTPFFALQSTIFMLEFQTATLGLVSLLAFLAVLEGQGWRAGAIFVLAASACILTKANGWALLISAGVGYLCLRRQTRASFAAVAIVLAATMIVCFPFYFVFVHAMSDGNADTKPALWFTLEAVSTYLRESAEVLGLAVSALFLVRLVLCARDAYLGQKQQPLIVLLVAWTVGPFVFQTIVPASFEIRHLAIAFPCVVLLAFTVVPQWLGRTGRVAVIGAGIAVLLLTVPWTMPDRYSELFRMAAPQIVSRLSTAPNKAVLITSNGPGEGRLVACMAALDPKGQYFCIRATKLIVDADWRAVDYHLLVRTREDVLKKLDSVPVSYVAVHDMVRKGLPHHELLRDALNSAPDRWRLIKVLESVSIPDGKETLAIYEASANLAKPVTTLDLDMHRKLNRRIVLEPEQRE
jgi:hypothetical protein